MRPGTRFATVALVVAVAHRALGYLIHILFRGLFEETVEPGALVQWLRLLIGWTVAIVSFPVTFFPRALLDRLGDSAFIINSLAWGIAVAAIYLFKLRSAQQGGAVDAATIRPRH